MATAVLATGHALLGEAAESARWAERIDDRRSGYGFLEPELSLGRAWALVAAGRVVEARTVLVTAADQAEQTSHVPVAAWLLHDAIRLGGGQPEAARLSALVSRTDSRLVAARAAHGRALVNDDPSGLAAAAEEFEAIGALLLAAEAATAAAEAWKRRQQQRPAAALLLRAGDLSERCEGAVTPGLVRSPGIVPLTGREWDVARLAAAGHSSRLIAERLYLSVRTVDNHLGHVYEKLGVSGRSALAEVLGRDHH